MKKTTLILIALLMILNSCTTGSKEVSSSELPSDLPPIYDKLEFDNQTPLDEMEICNITRLNYGACFPKVKRRTFSSVLYYDQFKYNFEHLYIRRNGDNVYSVSRIKYEGEIYYVINILEPDNEKDPKWLLGEDGALIHGKLLDISDFKDIKPGKTSRKKVKEIDKTAFLYTGSFGSEHRLRDGRMLYVRYKEWTGDVPKDEDIIVEQTSVREDEYGFLDKLLPMDREIIT